MDSSAVFGWGRLLALFVSLTLTLPSPAFGLRPEAGLESQTKTGLEDALREGRPLPTAGLEEFPDPALVSNAFKTEVGQILHQRQRGFDHALASLITADLANDPIGQETVEERNRARAIYVLWQLDTEVLDRVRSDNDPTGELYYNLLFDQQQETYQAILRLLGREMVEGTYVASFMPPALIDVNRVPQEYRGLRDLRYGIARTLVRLDAALSEYFRYWDRNAFVVRITDGRIRSREDIVGFVTPIVGRLESWQREYGGTTRNGYNEGAVLSTIATLQDLAELRPEGPDPYRTWIRQGTTVEVEWSSPITGRTEVHRGVITSITNVIRYPIIWMSDHPFGIYVRDITKATPLPDTAGLEERRILVVGNNPKEIQELKEVVGELRPDLVVDTVVLTGSPKNYSEAVDRFTQENPPLSVLVAGGIPASESPGVAEFTQYLKETNRDYHIPVYPYNTPVASNGIRDALEEIPFARLRPGPTAGLEEKPWPIEGKPSPYEMFHVATAISARGHGSVPAALHEMKNAQKELPPEAGHLFGIPAKKANDILDRLHYIVTGIQGNFDQLSEKVQSSPPGESQRLQRDLLSLYVLTATIEDIGMDPQGPSAPAEITPDKVVAALQAHPKYKDLVQDPQVTVTSPTRDELMASNPYLPPGEGSRPPVPDFPTRKELIPLIQRILEVMGVSPAGVEEGVPRLTLAEAVKQFRVEPDPAGVVQNVGFLLMEKGIAFAVPLALLEAKGLLNIYSVAGVVETKQDKERLLAIVESDTRARELIQERVFVVEEQEGETHQARWERAIQLATSLLFGTVIQTIDTLEPNLLDQLNRLLARFGYRLPKDPSVQQAARTLLQAA